MAEQDASQVMTVLSHCRDIERTCAELYEYYAELFKQNPDIAKLWAKTAAEERSHVAQFEMALRLREALVETVFQDAGKVVVVLERFIRFLDKVRNEPPTLEEALCSAIAMEEEVADYHLESIAKFRQESSRQVFHAMMAADHDHLEALEEAYRQLRPLPEDQIDMVA